MFPTYQETYTYNPILGVWVRDIRPIQQFNEFNRFNSYIDGRIDENRRLQYEIAKSLLRDRKHK